MKSLGAQWIMELHAYMLAKPEIIKNGFRTAGCTQLLVLIYIKIKLFNLHTTCVLCNYHYYYSFNASTQVQHMIIVLVVAYNYYILVSLEHILILWKGSKSCINEVVNKMTSQVTLPACNTRWIFIKS